VAATSTEFVQTVVAQLSFGGGLVPQTL